MNRFFLLLSLLLFFVVPGCSSVNVDYDYDPVADFAAIHTYGWGQASSVDDELARNPLLKKRIIASIDNYLQNRGFKKVESGQADVLVVIQAMVKEKMRVTDWGGPRGYYRDPWYNPWWGAGAYGSRVDISYYQEGTLVIDIVDNSKKELIWRGLGRGIVSSHRDKKKQQAAVDTYVQEILNNFPPGYEKKSK
jgi:hypothetical protein